MNLLTVLSVGACKADFLPSSESFKTCVLSMSRWSIIDSLKQGYSKVCQFHHYAWNCITKTETICSIKQSTNAYTNLTGLKAPVSKLNLISPWRACGFFASSSMTTSVSSS